MKTVCKGCDKTENVEITETDFIDSFVLELPGIAYQLDGPFCSDCASKFNYRQDAETGELVVNLLVEKWRC